MLGNSKNKYSFLLFSALIISVSLVFSYVGIIYSNMSLARKALTDISFSETSPLPTIVIDAGHGGEDGGASSYGGSPEKDLNLLISNHLCNTLTAMGFKVVMTRTDDTLLYDKNSDYKGHKKSMDLANRLRIANSYNNSILISIHMNAFPQKQYKGLQVYYSKNSDKSKRLAELIQQLNKSFIAPDNNRAAKQAGSNIYLLDRSTETAVLIECGFLSNDEERELLNSTEYQKKLAACFAAALINFISVDYSEKTV